MRTLGHFNPLASFNKNSLTWLIQYFGDEKSIFMTECGIGFLLHHTRSGENSSDFLSIGLCTSLCAVR